MHVLLRVAVLTGPSSSGSTNAKVMHKEIRDFLMGSLCISAATAGFLKVGQVCMMVKSAGMLPFGASGRPGLAQHSWFLYALNNWEALVQSSGRC